MLGLLLVPGRGAVVRELDADVVCEPGPSGSSLVRCGGNFGSVGPSVGLKTASASLGKLLPGIIFFSRGRRAAGPGNGKPGGASRVESVRRWVPSARDSNPDALPELR